MSRRHPGHPGHLGPPGAPGHVAGTTLLVIAKEPVPGRVKTRLGPHYSPAQAAALAEAALADTLRAGLGLPARRRVVVLDGTPGAWLPSGYEVVPQVGGTLDVRLAAAFGGCDGPALLIGMDTPQITPGLLAPVFAAGAWDTCDAWFGPAADGGFWALGLADPHRTDLLLGVPMSTDRTGAVQRQRLTAAGLRIRDLPLLRDVDTPPDAAEVARLAPETGFARVVGELAAPGPSLSDAAEVARLAPETGFARVVGELAAPGSVPPGAAEAGRLASETGLARVVGEPAVPGSVPPGAAEVGRLAPETGFARVVGEPASPGSVPPDAAEAGRLASETEFPRILGEPAVPGPVPPGAAR